MPVILGNGIASNDYALVLRPGETLARRAVSCPTGEYSVVHQHDGNVVVYRNADRFAVWSTGTRFHNGVTNPDDLATDDFDRAFGRAGRLTLQDDGDLVVCSPASERLWSSGTAGEEIAALMIHDWGKLVLKNAQGHVLWASDRAPKRWDGWNRVCDGRRLRRGQCLRNGSLVSDNGDYAFVVGEEDAVYLCRTNGPVLWAAANREGEGFEFTPDGRLITRTADGIEHPASSLKISESAATKLAGRKATELLVTDDGQLVLADDTGAIIWTMEPPETRYQEFMRRRRETPPPQPRPRPRVPAGVPPLPAGDAGSVPVVRTDFSDDAAWQDAVARVSAEYRDELLGDPWSIEVTPIDDPRYANLTPEQVAALASNDLWPMLVLADPRTMASPERHLLMVCLDENEDWGRTTRATAAAVVEVATNLWVGNMGWGDYMDPDDAGADSDTDVFKAWNLKEP